MRLYEGMTLDERYIVIRSLGEGGMGAAHLVKNQRLDRLCVIKEMLSLDDASQSQFEREAKLLASLHHPNLPEVYRYFFHQGHPFLVMEYVEGQTLDQLQSQRSAPFEVSDVLRWAQDLLSALRYMHERSPPVIHRDIKPSNVCITPQGRAVLLDFGIARPLDETRTKTAAQVFTHCYAPIEQYRRDQVKHIPTVWQFIETLRAEHFRTGAHTDIYGLGATLYFALTQLPPPDAAMRVLQDELRSPQKVNPLVPAFVAEIVIRALNIHPGKRFQSAAEMLNALQPATSHPVLPQPGPHPRPRPFNKQVKDVRKLQPRWLMLGIVVGLVLLAAVAGLTLFGGKGGIDQLSATATATGTPTLTVSPSNTPLPTNTPIPTIVPATVPPLPTATASATATATPTPTVTPSATAASSPTPYSFYFAVSPEQLNVYAAPGEIYEVLGEIRRGDRLQVTGQLDDGSWWQVDFFGLQGWTSAQPTGPEIVLDALPVVTPPVLPTSTFTSTPTPTSSPEPECLNVPSGEFGDVWREELTKTRLGCPEDQAHITESAYAVFQYGFMHWRGDRRLIYVFYNDGSWQEFVDTWQEHEPSSAELDPPPGLLEPIRGFGKVWREQLGGPEAIIGWATEEEGSKATTIEDFEGGTILKLDTAIYLLYRDTMMWQRYSPGIGAPPTRPPMPSSLRLAFVVGFLDDADIWVTDANGSSRFQLAGGSGEQAEPDWSPDGKHIVYQSNQTGNYDVWIIDADGKNARPLTSASVDEREPDWSPDGQQIVYRHGGERNDDGELWVMDADGNNQRALGGQQVIGRTPVWSPDGQQVAFMSNRSDAWDIYLFDLESGDVRRLTDCSTHCRFPAWSLDGQYIAYNVAEGLDSFSPIQIWRVRADGSETPQQLIEGNNPGRPTWSVEGLVAFNVSDGIEIMNTDGSDRHRLANSDEGWAPDWSR